MLNYNQPDAKGHFGPYGGSFVAETLMAPLAELAPALMLPQGSVTACLAACAQDGIRRLDIPPESRQG